LGGRLRAIVALGKSAGQASLNAGASVSSKTPVFDQAFIQKQRRQLTKLREELLPSMKAEEKEETQLHSQSVGDAHEAEDDAQKLAMLEIEGTAVARNIERLKLIERALQKIEDGTYGFSDASGEAIQRERLEAVPEAIFTLAELEAREAKDDPRSAAGKKI